MRLRFSFLRKSPLFLKRYKLFSFRYIIKYLDDRSVDVSSLFEFFYVCKYLYFYIQRFIFLIYTVCLNYLYLFVYTFLYFFLFYMYFLYSDVCLLLVFKFFCIILEPSIAYFLCVLIVYRVFFLGFASFYFFDVLKSLKNSYASVVSIYVKKIYFFVCNMSSKLYKLNFFLKWSPVFKRHSYLGLWRVYRHNFVKLA